MGYRNCRAPTPHANRPATARQLSARRISPILADRRPSPLPLTLQTLKYERRLIGTTSEHRHYRPSTPDPCSPRTWASPTTTAPGVRQGRRRPRRRAGPSLSPTSAPAGTDRSHRPPKMADEVTSVFKKNQRGFGFIITDVPYRGGDVFVPPTPSATPSPAIACARSTAPSGAAGAAATAAARGGQAIIIGSSNANAPPSPRTDPNGRALVVMPTAKTQPIVVKDPAVRTPGKATGRRRSPSTPRGFDLAEGVIARFSARPGSRRRDPGRHPRLLAPRRVPQGDRRPGRIRGQVFEAEVAGTLPPGYDPPEREDLTQTHICTHRPARRQGRRHQHHTPRRRRAGTSASTSPTSPTSSRTTSAPSTRSPRTGQQRLPPAPGHPHAPEVLSNGICSLSEGVVHVSAFMTYSPRDACSRAGVASTAIRSASCLTYLRGPALIDGDLKEAASTPRPSPSTPDQLIQTCARDGQMPAIRERRRQARHDPPRTPRGEPDLRRDQPSSTPSPKTTPSRTRSSMPMVEANEVPCASSRARSPLLRRVHPDPTPGDVNDLRTGRRRPSDSPSREPVTQGTPALLDATAGTSPRGSCGTSRFCASPTKAE